VITAAAFARSCFWPSDAGRWSPPGFCSSCSEDSSSGGAVSPPLLPRQAHDCDERQVADGATARRHEQGDFGSGVEAEPEQATQGYMCHGFVTALVARPYKRLMNWRELSRSSSSVSS
jgi:hypothetical protein